MGVTLELMQKLRMDENHDGKLDVNDLHLITLPEVENLFFKHFWDAIRADELPDGIDLILVDVAFNSGPGKAFQFIKEGYDTDIDALVRRRRQFYQYQADNVEGQKKFLNGWLARATRSGIAAKACVVAA
jgi:hypothetical protein